MTKAKLASLGLALAVVSVPVYEGIRLVDYRDPVGIPTACMGHTATAVLGTHRELAECFALMYADVYEHHRHVQRLVTVPLAPHQHAALVHFTYNVGPGALARSTLLRKVNACDFAGAAREFGRWVHATQNGRKVRLPGLVARRAHEAAMFRGEIPLNVAAFERLPAGAAETPPSGAVNASSEVTPASSARRQQTAGSNGCPRRPA